MRALVKLFFLGVFVLAATWWVATLQDGPRTRRPQPALLPPDPPRAEADQATQDKRRELLAEYQRAGVVKTLDTPGSMPRLYVDPLRWAALDFDAKQTLCGLAFAYAYALPLGETADEHDLLAVYDAKTDKRLGMFSSYGLDLD